MSTLTAADWFGILAAVVIAAVLVLYVVVRVGSARDRLPAMTARGPEPTPPVPTSPHMEPVSCERCGQRTWPCTYCPDDRVHATGHHYCQTGR